ncbi:LamG-like jellyroll fold domain-containing protein, partial [Archaeoglobus sp.]|uniref:LamG-like jellyroll fold domain-containing protein n=1 Tax=Archaeoglobus sp. TaxID=1872626 RepID=UPI0025C1CAB8
MNPPTDGLVLFYAPDSVDTANGKWLDKSGNGNDGTIYGASYIPLRPVSESTPSASAPYGLYFDGVDDYGVIPALFTVDEGQDWSVVVLFKLNSLNPSYPYSIILSSYLAVNGIRVDSDDKDIIILVKQTDGSTTGVNAGTAEIGKWLMVGASVKSGQYARAYLNGQFSQEKALNADTDRLARDWIIGRNEGSDTQFADMDIALILIYNRALSDSEMQVIYNDPLNPPTDGLVLWLAPDSVDTANGKWLNRAEILNTGLVEQLDGTQYGTLLIPVRWTT